MRIKKEDLQAIVDRLNIEAAAPREYGVVGHYQLSSGYGGYSLHRVVNERGAVQDVFNSGHIRGRELYQMINAYILGLKARIFL